MICAIYHGIYHAGEGAALQWEGKKKEKGDDSKKTDAKTTDSKKDAATNSDTKSDAASSKKPKSTKSAATSD